MCVCVRFFFSFWFLVHNAEKLDLPSEEINQCLISNQMIETNVHDDDKQSTSSPVVSGELKFEPKNKRFSKNN